MVSELRVRSGKMTDFIWFGDDLRDNYIVACTNSGLVCLWSSLCGGDRLYEYVERRSKFRRVATSVIAEKLTIFVMNEQGCVRVLSMDDDDGGDNDNNRGGGGGGGGSNQKIPGGSNRSSNHREIDNNRDRWQSSRIKRQVSTESVGSMRCEKNIDTYTLLLSAHINTSSPIIIENKAVAFCVYESLLIFSEHASQSQTLSRRIFAYDLLDEKFYTLQQRRSNVNESESTPAFALTSLTHYGEISLLKIAERKQNAFKLLACTQDGVVMFVDFILIAEKVDDKNDEPGSEHENLIEENEKREENHSDSDVLVLVGRAEFESLRLEEANLNKTFAERVKQQKCDIQLKEIEYSEQLKQANLKAEMNLAPLRAMINELKLKNSAKKTDCELKLASLNVKLDSIFNLIEDLNETKLVKLYKILELLKGHEASLKELDLLYKDHLMKIMRSNDSPTSEEAVEDAQEYEKRQSEKLLQMHESELSGILSQIDLVKAEINSSELNADRTINEQRLANERELNAAKIKLSGIKMENSLLKCKLNSVKEKTNNIKKVSLSSNNRLN
jgi:hypothetical protein